MSNIIWYPGHELLLPDIVRAENCYLFDADGKRYVDLESGVWCTSIGHNHPRIKAVVESQYERIAHGGFNYSNAIVEAAGATILDLLDFENGRCVFLCSGSEAVEYSVRVARSFAPGPLMLTMSDSYFGAYGAAANRDVDAWVAFDWSPCAMCQTDVVCAHCEHWAAVPFDQIGGFLFEPGGSSGFVRFPPEKLIRAIVTKVQERGGLVVVNEVTTGVGRTGKWFGYQHYGIRPDIVAMGKGIGNGYPVSVTAFEPKLNHRLDASPPKYAQSHQNDPLGAAIAMAVVKTIADEQLIDKSQPLSNELLAGLETVKKETGRINTIRGRGLMAAIDLRTQAGNPRAEQVHRELIKRGYVVGRRPGAEVLRLDPSLTIQLGDLEWFLLALKQAL